MLKRRLPRGDQVLRCRSVRGIEEANPVATRRAGLRQQSFAERVMAEIAYPVTNGAGSLFAVAGTAALTTDQQTKTSTAASTQTVRIMDFSDPQHPKVARQFDGVTSISRDERRSLIFLANGEGIWILRQSYAEDPEAKKEYEKYILYNR